MSKKILGISDTHNCSAALMLGDELFGLQEERPRGIKNYSGLPSMAIEALLEKTGNTVSDLDIVAMAGHYQPPERDRQELIKEYREINGVRSSIKRILRNTPIYKLKQSQNFRTRMQRLNDLGLPDDKIRFYDHHTCHAAAAYYGWGKLDEPILVITCDGAGDNLCATIGVGENGSMKRLESVHWSNSFAILYAVVTYMMGMVPLEHEYKIMGMAPYAKSEGASKIANKLLDLFEWDPSGRPVWQKKSNVPHMWYIKAHLEDLFFEERFDSIMAGVQQFTEEMLCELINRAINTTGLNKIAMSGGVFMNVKANKLIMENERVQDLFVFPSCGDETNSIGACYLAQHELGHSPAALSHFYLGFEPSENEIDEICSKTDAGYEITRPSDINLEVAKLLHAGEVVARFDGREEFGARSLGNRAILANPSQPKVIQTINEMIKNRDFWMPFAASVLDDDEGKYLQNPKQVDAPYMILSFDSKPEFRKEIEAGTHPYDGTCRPQVVSKDMNPDYWDLINKFKSLSGIGAVLNTSLNLHGDPLVHTAADAFRVLEKSGLRHLILGKTLISKS